MTARILIVEDEAVIAMGAQSILEDAGFAVAGVAATVSDAIGRLNRGGIDAVVLDANLNGESAEPVAERLRHDKIPFVAVSGYVHHAIQDWAGGGALIQKPYRQESLLLALRAALGERA